MAVSAGSQADADLHLVAGRACDLRLFPGIDQLGGPPGLQSDEGRIDLADCSLLGAEASSDPGLFHPDSAFGNAEGAGQRSEERRVGKGWRAGWWRGDKRQERGE